MSLHASLHASLAAVYTADTGAGGLNGSSGDARVLRWERWGHPDVSQERIGPWPYVVAQIVGDDPNDPFASTAAGGGSVLTVRLHVYTNRDQKFTRMDAVMARLRESFNGATLSSQNSWSFSAPYLFRQFVGPATGNELHEIAEFGVLAQKA